MSKFLLVAVFLVAFALMGGCATPIYNAQGQLVGVIPPVQVRISTGSGYSTAPRYYTEYRQVVPNVSINYSYRRDTRRDDHYRDRRDDRYDPRRNRHHDRDDRRRW